MSEDTYEYECMRAELLGIEKPDEDAFNQAKADRLQQQQDEIEAAEAALLESHEEALRNTGGKLDELNSILSSTQQKLNRFKQAACGSLTNIFNKGSVDLPDATATTSKTNNDDKISTHSDENLETTNEDEDAIDGGIQPIIPTEKIRNAKLDIQKKMTSHLDKLDSLLNKAEQAEISMTEQTKQMRQMTK